MGPDGKGFSLLCGRANGLDAMIHDSRLSVAVRISMFSGLFSRVLLLRQVFEIFTANRHSTTNMYICFGICYTPILALL